MQLVQVIYSVLIRLVNALVMLDSKAPHATLCVGVIPLVRVEQLVMLLLASVLVIPVIQEQRVIHVPPITTEQVVERAQVSPIPFSFMRNEN